MALSWFGRDKAAYHAFLSEPSFPALRRILQSIGPGDFAFDVLPEDLRDRLFNLDWKASSDQLIPSEREFLFATLDEYLLNPASRASRRDWQSWIKMSRLAGRLIEVNRPLLASGILKAKREGKITDLPRDDADYLWTCYLRAYGELLDRSSPADHQLMLPVVLEFTALAQLLGPTEYSSRVLRRWTEHARLRPRGLANVNEPESFDAPIRGVGSPNGVGVTLYHDRHQSTPVRIAFAGITADRSLNAHMLASFFSAGLASDSERSFITAAGGFLHLGPGGATASAPDIGVTLHAAIGPDGNPIETEAGISTLGMTPDEAFDLVEESFERFKNGTGLAGVMHWSVADADALEARVRDAFSEVDRPTRRIKSDPGHSQECCVIHVMPLLHRNEEGMIEPVRIPVPFGVLAPDAVLELTRNARQSYMGQLIADGRRREAVASDMHKRADEKVKEWAAKSPAGKDAACKAHPVVQITHTFNFDLGISTPVVPPDEIPRATYEEVNRPAFRDSAAEYATKFGKLCEKLETLNRGNGHADRLTFRLLVDAAIRRTPLPIPGSQFEADYARWSGHVAGPVWGVIEEWAGRRPYPAELLAADSVMFIPKLSEDEKSVWIEPHVAIDLHNFEITVDATQGVMYVLPGGRPVALKDRMVRSSTHGITDPTSLYQRFKEWSETRLNVLATRASAEKRWRQELIREKRFAGLLLLRQGKRLLAAEEFDRSIAAFAQARRADLAPVYFWGAVAHQCQFLRQWHPRSDGTRTENRESILRLIKLAANALIDSASGTSAGSAAAGLWTSHLEVPIPVSRPMATSAKPTDAQDPPSEDPIGFSPPVAPEARFFWNQLLACDPRFVEGLMTGDRNLDELESASLGITADEDERLEGATHALCALDFLALAERMKTVARALPFAGLPSDRLRAELEAVVKGVRAMPFEDPPAKNQIEELSGRFSQL